MALTVSSVSHAYAGVPVIADLDLSVETGELVALTGPSGCGKSTLLRIIAGLESPDSGRVRLDDSDITGTPGSVGLVFQEASLYPWLTVEDNVAFGLRIQGRAESEIGPRVSALLELTGLADAARVYPTRLSGGMAQRAALARALAPEPRVLLMDEPFGAVDLHLRAYLQDEVLRIWRQTGTTILLVTHSIDEAVRMGDRVVVLSGPPARVAHEVGILPPHPRTGREPGLEALRERILEWGRGWSG